MKLMNQLLSGILILTFSLFLMSGKPTTSAARKSAMEYVNKLSLDVQLTDSQSLAIETYLAEFFTDVKVAHDKSNSTERRNIKTNLYIARRNFLETILTDEQKKLIEEKKALRKTQAGELSN